MYNIYLMEGTYMSLPVALQLYSVRRELEQDFEATIQNVAEMGYEGVELSGIGDNQDPKELKETINMGCVLFPLIPRLRTC